MKGIIFHAGQLVSVGGSDEQERLNIISFICSFKYLTHVSRICAHSHAEISLWSNGA